MGFISLPELMEASRRLEANALSGAGRFGLTEDKAKTVIEQVRIIVGQWRERLAGDGVGEADLERLQTAFLTGSVFAGYSDS